MADSAFQDQVRSALLHLHDVAYLQTSPLGASLPASEAGTPAHRSGRGAALGRDLLAAVEALRPTAAGAAPLAARRHRLMLLRYVEALDVPLVARELSISRGQYYLDHRVALAALASVLRERWEACRLAAEPPARSDRIAAAAIGPPLPGQLTSLIEREAMVQGVRDRLAEARIVTLTGPPGAGKTRLALAVAHALASEPPDATRFSDGVRFVALAPVAEAGLVVPTIAHALGVPQTAGPSPLAGLTAWLQRRQLLLVLDNFEQVALAAPALTDLLAGCPGLRLLITSRAALRLPGEHEMLVPPLTVPPADSRPRIAALSGYGAVRLFVERARAGRRGFAVTARNANAIAEVCRRLDGLPLAIELAAARVRVLSPVQIAARLDDLFGLLSRDDPHAPPHQRSLRGAMDWSYALLTEPERVVLRQLSAFAGGSTLEAIEAVCGEPRLLDSLERLIDQSLVSTFEVDGAVRYGLLEPVRQYGAERLRESHETEAVRDRHLDWFVRFSERELAHIHQSEHFATMAHEHDNVRVALRWSVDRDQPEQGFRLLAANLATYYARGYHAEGRQWFDELSRLPLGWAPSIARGRALILVGQLAHNQGNAAQAEAYLREALVLARGAGDELGSTQATHVLAHVALQGGDLDAAWDRYRAAANAYARQGEEFWRLNALEGLARVALLRDDPAETIRIADQALLIAGERGMSFVVGRLNPLRAQAAVRAGDRAAARELCAAGLAAAEGIGDRVGILEALIGLADLERDGGRSMDAGRIYARALGDASALGQRREVARCLEGLAAASTDAPERWMQVGAAADAIRRAAGAAPWPRERVSFERWRDGARASIGGDASARAEARGSALTAGLAIELALAERAPG